MAVVHVLGREFAMPDSDAACLEGAGVLYREKITGNGKCDGPRYRIAPDLPDFVTVEGDAYRGGSTYLAGYAAGLRAAENAKTGVVKAARDVLDSWHKGQVLCNARENRTLSTLEFQFNKAVSDGNN